MVDTAKICNCKSIFIVNQFDRCDNRQHNMGKFSLVVEVIVVYSLMYKVLFVHILC